MKFLVACLCAYACTSTLTGSAQNVAHRIAPRSTASSLRAFAGSVMSARIAADPDLNRVTRSADAVSSGLVTLGNAGEPAIMTLRHPASSGPMSMYDCPVIHPEDPTVSIPPLTPSAPSRGCSVSSPHSNTTRMDSLTPQTYPPWPCTTPLGRPVEPEV